MKILTLCAYGNVRSVCLAHQLKDWYYQECLAAGLVANTPTTLLMLIDWADIVLPTDKSLNPDDYIHLGRGDSRWSKFVFDHFDVGPDIWHSPTHPDLIGLMTSKIESADLFPRRIIPQ